MCDKMLNYFLFFMFILSLANSIRGQETTTEAESESTTTVGQTDTSSMEPTTESESETTVEPTLGSTMESATGPTTILSVTEESTTTTSSTESMEITTLTQDPSAEPEPESDAEPEPTAEAEPTSELKPPSELELPANASAKAKSSLNLKSKPSPTSNITTKLEPIKKMEQMNVTQAGEKSGDKCSCPVSGVLTSMVEVLKDLHNEVQAMKSQMILKCPGFGSDNDTEESGDKVADSLEMANATEAATEIEDVSEGPTTTPLPPIPTECDPPFLAVASSCYYFLYYPQDWKSWGEANAYCQTLGGTLAAPHRFGDLKEYLVNNFSNVFWIGAKKALKGPSYEWITGKTFQKENWKDGDPSKAAARYCLYVESVSGYQAVNYYCGEKFSFICEKRGSEAETAKDS